MEYSSRGGGGVIVVFPNNANIYLHTVSKKYPSNNIPSDLPSEFYETPLFLAPRIS